MTRLNERTQYPISVDCVVFGYTEGQLKVALIERKKPPFVGMWAIPGGFMIDGETVEEAAFRELHEETGIHDIYLEQFHVFSRPDRDPRGRVVTVAFFALIKADQVELVATEDAARAKWWQAYDLPELAFDHEEIFTKALETLRIAFKFQPLAFELLPKEFTLTEMQRLYEEVYGEVIDKRNFRKKVHKMEFIRETGKKTEGGRHRPGMLYRFDQKIYNKSIGTLYQSVF